jgi:hypothetical protein
VHRVVAHSAVRVLPIDNGAYLGPPLPASPRPTRRICAHEVMVEAQLRDVAILLLIALLFVLTLQVLRLTRDQSDDGQQQ